jgi:hypothetical protein
MWLASGYYILHIRRPNSRFTRYRRKYLTVTIFVCLRLLLVPTADNICRLAAFTVPSHSCVATIPLQRILGNFTPMNVRLVCEWVTPGPSWSRQRLVSRWRHNAVFQQSVLTAYSCDQLHRIYVRLVCEWVTHGPTWSRQRLVSR